MQLEIPECFDSLDDALKAAVAGSQRTPAFVTRDVWRHPVETLSFMGIQPNMTVVEILDAAHASARTGKRIDFKTN